MRSLDFTSTNLNLSSNTCVIDIDLFHKEILDLGRAFIDDQIVGFTIAWMSSDYKKTKRFLKLNN